MRIIMQVLSIITIAFVVLTSFTAFYILNQSPDYEVDIVKPVIEFMMNEDEGTLTVTDINFDGKWDKVYISGTALTPKGSIDVGDKITFCTGNVVVSYNGVRVGGYVFGDETAIEPIAFIGDWENVEQRVSFDASLVYTNVGKSKETDDEEDGVNYSDNWGSDKDNESPSSPSSGSIPLQSMGFYDVRVRNVVFVEADESYEKISVDSYNYTFSDDLTTVNFYKKTDMSFSYTLSRNLNDTIVVNALNISKKLDSCLIDFVNNYTDSNYSSALSDGLNVTVDFTSGFNLTTVNESVDFYYISINNININGSNYEIRVDSLLDLYELVIREDVVSISASDKRFNEFGCIV